MYTIAVIKSVQLHSNSFGVFTNTQIWQYCQLCTPRNLQFSSLLELNGSKCTINICGSKRITFEDCKLHCCYSLLMSQLKQSWQYWHSCIVEILWKPLLLWNRHKTLSQIIWYTWQGSLTASHNQQPCMIREQTFIVAEESCIICEALAVYIQLESASLCIPLTVGSLV